MRARANPGALAKVRALMAAGSAAAVDDPEELHAAGLPRALPGGLASDAIHQRAKLLWYTLQQRQHSNSGSGSTATVAASAAMVAEATLACRRVHAMRTTTWRHDLCYLPFCSTRAPFRLLCSAQQHRSSDSSLPQIPSCGARAGDRVSARAVM